MPAASVLAAWPPRSFDASGRAPRRRGDRPAPPWRCRPSIRSKAWAMKRSSGRRSRTLPAWSMKIGCPIDRGSVHEVCLPRYRTPPCGRSWRRCHDRHGQHQGISAGSSMPRFGRRSSPESSARAVLRDRSKHDPAALHRTAASAQETTAPRDRRFRSAISATKRRRCPTGLINLRFLESIAKKPGGISEHFAIVGRISW